jgi:SAM-dependent methyltransferase
MLVGTDVYASPNTVLVADAHRLPFANACFDGVWIQAVLEHVLEPHTVAAEIFRVLKPSGLVYADTPFMQQVHEQAYDFTRFTLSGHRWLFRNFSEIESGVVAGAGTAAVWSMRYFWRALTGNTSLGTLLAAPFFWLRFFDKLAKPRHNADAASGVFFFGMKGNESLRPKDMVTYYEMQKISVG